MNRDQSTLHANLQAFAHGSLTDDLGKTPFRWASLRRRRCIVAGGRDIVGKGGSGYDPRKLTHNPEVVGSNPTPATNKGPTFQRPRNMRNQQ
jgi:hypothetical protein